MKIYTTIINSIYEAVNFFRIFFLFAALPEKISNGVGELISWNFYGFLTVPN